MNKGIKESQPPNMKLGRNRPGPSGKSEVGSLASNRRRGAWASAGARDTQGGPRHKAVRCPQRKTLFEVSFVWVWLFCCFANSHIQSFRIIE